ncbi:MAG: carboxypeptidase-like regulatory domain-containing protein, partial [Chitinivibrionales bacterium]|nr:carboxypeptidase-like regulatory domain-containing protein [Chitinivibrionales bacterium]
LFMKTNLTVLLLAAAVGLALRCGNAPSPLTGNGSQTKNAFHGTLYEPDGKTPAAHAAVLVRRKNSLANVPAVSLSKILGDTASVFTDKNGEFFIDSVDTGTYTIQGNDNNGNYVLIDSVKKTASDSLALELGADTLKPAGAMRGIVVLSQGGDPASVYVLAFGIDRFTTVNADGSFLFPNLARGNYHVRLITGLKDYGALDTQNIRVNSGDTTNLNTLRMPFTGIPTPGNLGAAYDTLRQQVVLSWNRADTALVRGYNIFRSIDNGYFTLINKTTVKDTFFRTEIQNGDFAATAAYSYRVACLDSSGNEGKNSGSVTVKTISTFPLVDSIVLPKEFDTSYHSVQAFRPLYQQINNRFYLFGFTAATMSLAVYDYLGVPVGVRGPVFAVPYNDQFGVDSHGSMYFLTQSISWEWTISKFSAANDSLNKWRISFGDGNNVAWVPGKIHVDASDNIYITGLHHSSGGVNKIPDHFICKFDTNKTVQDSFAVRIVPTMPYFGINNLEDALEWLDAPDSLLRIYSWPADDTMKMTVMTPDLGTVRTVAFAGFGHNGPQGIDLAGRYYLTGDDSYAVRPLSGKVFSASGEFVAAIQPLHGQIIKISDAIYSWNGSNMVYKYKMPW